MKEKSFSKFHWEFINHLEDYDKDDDFPHIMVIEMRENEKGFIYPEDLDIEVEDIIEKIKSSEDEEELYEYLYEEGIVEWM